MNIGKALIELRAEYNLTQKELSIKSGVTQSFISMLESGKRNNMNVKTADKFAKAFGVMLNEFLEKIND